ncbi:MULTISPECIES: glycosyltransferase [unclassified Dyella]|uniref:glycosyltransferase n=1 Tax=unclassified Dyella TaxID=2634549 RepID=UPI000C828234|nr:MULTISPECIES: glycosyltransferase [unclassified Dyella]MDR3444384.1 glycosyltransferase [Dyella sp.]PMQ06033.1 N-acetylglucosaminyl-diphospho-decaprenol L-rhamnosyltransferase [Dyella sp. AD56]
MSSHVGWKLQQLGYTLKRVRGSLAQRGLKGTIDRIRQEFQSPLTEDAALTLDNVSAVAPTDMPCSATPTVSVIIPVHGKLDWTLTCLRSIARAGAETPFEVIVVDDASPDDTYHVLSNIPGLRVLRNEQNLGFIGTCNAGARAARGALLFFLNNDTQVMPGWLDTLVATHANEPDCGIVGSRLVYPDGRLQEAGCIVFADGQGWNVGRFGQREDPQYLYRRDVDYVSGAALLISRNLFDQVGGFDARYAPAYCEDMDLAFAVRATGKRVVYEPASVVVHFEGISSGLDPFSGVKRYQAVNNGKFCEKWALALKDQPSRKLSVDQALLHGHRHILIVDALTPDPNRDSGSLRLVNIMRLLREMGWRVTFMADNRRSTPAEISRLGAMGVRVLCKPWAPALPAWLAHEGKSLDAVMLCRHYVMAPHLPLIRKMAPKAKLLFDTVDLHFLREQRAAAHDDNPALAKQAQASRETELSLIRASDITFVVSPVEQKLIAAEVPEARVELLSNVHELFGRTHAYQEREGLVFVGGFAHPPNIDAVNWLVDDIYPRIRQQRPDIELHLIGDIPESEQRRLDLPGVHIHGRVADLGPWMERSRIALAPLRYGAGVKGKVNMAMSHGLPVVASTIASEGMNLERGESVLVADDGASFASAILCLYDDPDLWLRLSDGGLRNIRDHFSFEKARATLEAALANP